MVIWNNPKVTEGSTRARRPDQVEAGGPPCTGLRHRAAAKTGQPVQGDGEHQDQQDAHEKGRQRDADQAPRHDQAGHERITVKGGVNAKRHPRHDREDGGGQREFQRRRQPLREQAGHGLAQTEADAELAVQHGPQVMGEAHHERLIQAQSLDEILSLRRGMVLAQKDGDRVSDIGEQHEGYAPDHQQNRDALRQTGEDQR